MVMQTNDEARGLSANQAGYFVLKIVKLLRGVVSFTQTKYIPSQTVLVPLCFETVEYQSSTCSCRQGIHALVHLTFWLLVAIRYQHDNLKCDNRTD